MGANKSGKITNGQNENLSEVLAPLLYELWLGKNGSSKFRGSTASDEEYPNTPYLRVLIHLK